MEMVKENKVDILGPPQSSAPGTTTVVTIQTETAVPDHIVWSLFNTIFMNWCCLGFAAFAYSVKSRDRKMVGDMTGARTYASTAKCLNVWALVLGLLLTITFIIFFVAGSLMISQTISEVIKQYGGP
ncbi:interferon-induced transmembrane protein 1-like [Ursus maritimus]|uniref:Interferon-induced transmembrane protein 1-like n=1 Tax=Ursus maritimus TaxID=29073 RepID=A0A384CSM3_URSMA|nr:interferon-induced transmembrane protein 1-like [Ursus maritimus]